jgi:hypothetical protein
MIRNRRYKDQQSASVPEVLSILFVIAFIVALYVKTLFL